MPRFPRSYIKTSFFHVITQGINKSYIFDKPEDIKYYIKTMYELVNQQDVNLIAYCIMNNHAHILIESNDLTQLSKYMHRLNTTYAIYYNKKYSRVGYIFRDRYKSEGIYSEEQLYNCINYIYNNPVKAGICKSPSEYPYSNYKNYKKNIKGNYIFLDVDIDTEYLCKKVVQEFTASNSLQKTNLINNTSKLKELIIILKENYNISLRQISKELNINREKIRKLYNE